MHKNAIPVWVGIGVVTLFALGLGVGSGWADDTALTVILVMLIMSICMGAYHAGVSDARHAAQKESEGR